MKFLILFYRNTPITPTINPITPPTANPAFPPSAAALLVELATEALEDTPDAPVPVPELATVALEASFVEVVVELATLVVETFPLPLVEVIVGILILGVLNEVEEVPEAVADTMPSVHHSLDTVE